MRIRMTESVEEKASYTVEYKDNDTGKVESYKTGSVSEYELLETLERLGFDALPEVEDDEDLITFLSNYDFDWDYDDSAILICLYKDGEPIYENANFDSFEDEDEDYDEDDDVDESIGLGNNNRDEDVNLEDDDYNIINIPRECIKGATLLSKEEYVKYKDNVPEIKGWWWLRSAGPGTHSACQVERGMGGKWCPEGYAYYYVYFDGGGVRPALILNLRSSGLDIKDEFKFGGRTFTIISNNLAICNSFIGRSCFREDRKSEDANVYEKSDVKKIVDNWFNENI